MYSSLARRPRVVLFGVCVMALGLGACSARKLAYRMAPTLLMSAVDDMLELTSSQKEWLRPQLRTLVDWHRREELPRWAASLEDLRRRLGDGLQPDDVKWTRATVDELMGRVARRLAPVGGELFARVTPAQIDHMKDEMARERRDRAGEDLSPERALEKQTKKRVKSLERWTGPLTPEQRRMVDEHVRRIAGDMHLRRALDNDRWGAFLDAQRNPQPAADRAAALLALMTRYRPEALPPHAPDSPAARLTVEEMKALYARIEAMNDDFAVRLWQTATPAQKQRIDRELASLQGDLVELAKD